MNLVVVTNLYPPYARGGAERIAFRLVNELYSRGHKVTVLSTKPFEGLKSLSPEVTSRHVGEVLRVFPPNLYHMMDAHKKSFPVRGMWHLIDMYNPLSGRYLRQVLKREKPDAVLTHNLKGFGLQVVPEIRRQGIKHIHTLHDVQLSVPSGLLIKGEEETWLNKGFPRKLYEKGIKKIFKSPDVVISPSQFLADFYTERGFFPKSDVQVIPNPAPELHVNTDLPELDGPVRLLFAGQLEKHKGILFLLDALEQSNLDYRLHIAGDGTLASEISDRAEKNKNVIYHGFVSLPNLTRLFAVCDGVVVPSLCYENSPSIIYESLQSSVPVIASDIGGTGELVKNGENGFLFPAGDKEKLLEALRWLAGERAQLSARRDQIKKSVEGFGMSGYADTLENIIKGAG